MLAPPTNLLTDGIDELSTIAIGCQKYGLVCTEKAEFDKFTIAIVFFGILIGVVCVLIFQYTRRKTEERIALAEANELAQKEIGN